ncbi:hypothetical protein TRFO_13345 [Tritrichomonas foetus]|uniref:Protein kinase domain-containing protein n=1 Tax=Tritrichomonas foetus TaxID=1144522 RepID=A0A1J4KZA3_9EUKA|nr:hypothetical protein TRFO_13345 [Tritrichomonas foetus]|eukprot:OHT16192.1 hypothetical protein TRFO_13345 [Tritrichomonas foetus]
MNSETKYTRDDFNLLELSGEGSYGKVYKAFDKKNQRIVAIKVFELATDDWLPLLTEVNLVIDLKHESIVNYFGWFFEEQYLWLVMEYCECSLSDVLDCCGTEDKDGTSHGLTEMQVSAVCRGLLEGLVYVHSKKRIHRDIKAGNILVTSDGKVKLCDFGVSAQLDEFYHETNTTIGSPLWMAPEVISSSGHTTKADIWSFGITALELLEGRAPNFFLPINTLMFRIVSAPPPQAPEWASEAFKKFVGRALVKDPKLRPTAEELLADPFIQMCGGRSQEILRDMVADFRLALEEEEEEEESEDEISEKQPKPKPYPSSKSTATSTIVRSENKPAASAMPPPISKKKEELDGIANAGLGQSDAKTLSASVKLRSIRRRSSIFTERKQSNPQNTAIQASKSEDKKGNVVMRPADVDDLESSDDELSDIYADNTFKALSNEAASSILYGQGTFVVNQGTFIVNHDYDETDNNSGTFVVNNTEDNSGTFVVNNGTFVVNNSGTFVENSGTFVNNGTFVANNGTFVANDGTMVVNNGAKEKHSGLTGWNLQFLNHQTKRIQKAQKRKFNNFGDNDLDVMLKSVRNVALTELKLGKDPKVIKANYDEVRNGIIQELRRRNKEIPDDYQILEV